MWTSSKLSENELHHIWGKFSTSILCRKYKNFSVCFFFWECMASTSVSVNDHWHLTLSWERDIVTCHLGYGTTDWRKTSKVLFTVGKWNYFMGYGILLHQLPVCGCTFQSVLEIPIARAPEAIFKMSGISPILAYKRIHCNIHRDLPTSNKCREVRVIPLTHSVLQTHGSAESKRTPPALVVSPWVIRLKN